MAYKSFTVLGTTVIALFFSQEIFADKVAAAIHILVDGDGNTLSALVAGAIGKNDATAAANTDGSGQIDVFAAGVGGTITPDGNFLGNISQDASRNTSSSNLPAGVVVDFDAITTTFSFDPDTNFTGNIVTDSKTTVHP